MPTLTFEPSGRTLEVEPGLPLLAAVLRAGLPIGYACRGLGVCTSCRLRVWGELAPPDAAERTLLRRSGAEAGERLACFVRLTADVRVQAGYW